MTDVRLNHAVLVTSTLLFIAAAAARAVTQRPSGGWTATTARSGDRLSTETREPASGYSDDSARRSPSTAVSGRDATSSGADDEYLNGHAARRADRWPVGGGRYRDYILLMQHTHVARLRSPDTTPTDRQTVHRHAS